MCCVRVNGRGDEEEGVGVIKECFGYDEEENRKDLAMRVMKQSQPQT